MVHNRDENQRNRALTRRQRDFAQRFVADVRGRLSSPKVTAGIYGFSRVWLLVDCSSSMEGEKLTQAKTGALNFGRDAIERGYGVGVIAFASTASRVCDITREVAQVQRAIDSLIAKGSTNLGQALELACEHLVASAKRGARAVVVVTDGYPDDVQSAIAAGKRLRDAGVSLIAIGTDDADHGFLRELATTDNLALYTPRSALQLTVSKATALLPRPSSLSTIAEAMQREHDPPCSSDAGRPLERGDVTPLTLGVRADNGVTLSVIPRGTALPVARSFSFPVPATRPPAVRLELVRGERAMAIDNRLFATYFVRGLEGLRQGATVRVTFAIDTYGILRLQAVETLSGQPLTVERCDFVDNMSENDIYALLQQASKFREKDEGVRMELLRQSSWRLEP